MQYIQPPDAPPSTSTGGYDFVLGSSSEVDNVETPHVHHSVLGKSTPEFSTCGCGDIRLVNGRNKDFRGKPFMAGRNGSCVLNSSFACFESC